MDKLIKWEDWGGAVSVSEGRREEWAQELIEKPMSHPNFTPMSYILSGDSMVVVRKGNDGSYEAFDCILRRRASGEPSDPVPVAEGGCRNPMCAEAFDCPGHDE